MSSVKCQVSSVRKSKGFTLIELLVVIALIGILASFAIAFFNSAQQKGRDSRRKGDLDAIKKALELAKGDSQGGTYYPGCPSEEVFCVLNASIETANPTISPNYIKTVPTDPKGDGTCSTDFNNAYCYIPSPNNCTGKDGAIPCTSYQLNACLENANEPVGGNVISFGSCTSLRAWRVRNP